MEKTMNVGDAPSMKSESVSKRRLFDNEENKHTFANKKIIL